MESFRIISAARFSLQLLICMVPFLIGRERRRDFGRRAACALIGYPAFTFLWWALLHLVPGFLPIANIAFYLGVFLAAMGGTAFCFELSGIEVLFAGTGGYATEHIVFALTRMLQYGTGWTSAQVGPVIDNLVFRLLAYIVGAAIMYYAAVRPNRDKEEFKENDIRMVYAATLILLTAIVLSVFYSNEAYSGGSTLVTEVICPAYSAICCLLVMMMEYYVFRENRLNREKKTMEQMLQLAGAQQKASKEAIDIINMKCHDLRHQLRALAEMNDSEQRAAYVKEAQQAISIYDMTYHTGCEAVDYVLREKALIADEYKVQFSCMVDGAAFSFLQPADIYALLGNALDNALESVLREREEERIISLNISRHGRMVSFRLENRCSRLVEFQDDLPVTDKEDKDFHGFGVQSIRYVVRKYQGSLSMSLSGGMFRLAVIFPEQKSNLE